MARSSVQRAREAPRSTKARILATAEEVFAARGFAGASTREIANRAGVNISSLHYHWDSKETLYYAVFQDIYDRIVDMVQAVGRAPDNPASSVRSVVETAVGRLFDFFYSQPNVPKLLMRRLLEGGETEIPIETDILAPAWKEFATWARQVRTRSMREPELTLFMLTAHGVMMLFLLDSKEFRSLLGGSVRSADVRKRVRAHVIRVVQRLVETP